jgi:hypothetical protein
MFNSAVEQKIEPPKLIPSLTEGFNTIANHIYIILFPVLFDILLWFGPLIRIKVLLLPIVLNATETTASAYGPDSQTIIENSKSVWTVLLEQFNLLYGLRTYPVGIPSLLVSKGVNHNPIGTVNIIEMQSSTLAFWLVVGMSVLGLILGSIYFSMIAGAVDDSRGPLKLSVFLKQAFQTMILSLLMLAGLIILSIPAICLISSIVLFLPSLGDLPIMLFGFLLVWMLLPLAFSPHGIFASQFKATTSIVNSIKLVRSLMSITGLFFISLILLGYGLDILWSTPAASDWMLLVGIIGHAFISSGLIAASFSFYKRALRWLQAKLQGMNAEKQKIVS